jgi:hypothetical protein
MTVAELLAKAGIVSAIVVDDVCDTVPMAGDIGIANDAWTIFNDDLSPEQRELIAQAFPAAAQLNFDQLIADDGYVAAVWNLRGELGAVAEPVFEQYNCDQASDKRFVDLAVERLSALGIACRTSGRDFVEAAQAMDLIVIDLFFNKAQDEGALSESKKKLRAAIDQRRATPPLVILMSRSPSLEAKRDEFRDDVGLLDSGFRIIRKADLEESGKLERQLARLAENAEDSRKLACFFSELETGMAAATSRTIKLLRNLRLSDVGQIQQLLLNAEGEPAGSYLVDVFDRVLQHEVERERGIIEAAIPLNAFSAASHPSPYVAGSPDLQALVERLLTQNGERLKLPGALDAQITFGDILTLAGNADLARLRATMPVDVDTSTAMLVLTPVCDLQRDGAPRILLLIGEINEIGVASWAYGEDARTAAIRLDNEIKWIKWNLKHIDTVSHDQLAQAFGNEDLKVAARLREAHALELQQKLLSGLGRVGLVAALPATFTVDVEIFYAGPDGIPTRLAVPQLDEGAVCFVGRDRAKAPMLRLVMTDSSTDGVVDALAALPDEKVAEAARTALGHVKSTEDVRHLLTNGVNLKGARPDAWAHIPSATGATNGIPKMGLLAWNMVVPNKPLVKGDLNKAGMIILVKDRTQAGALGLKDAIRSGLVVSTEATTVEDGQDA